ncbi:hypothetical protein CNYM01_06246 [Colletotrichum nymphaeae SA-01]|uniref:Uncharacterized protein n=1 Tax=Colletotrichum nymphaeae SA-01 TaxID=1460502 RepID=A0A135SVV2_9PEZI|nr:hypothetical protein CNYM01_06246 [Colletotrichum nymphaeae SA-01]
MPVPTGHRTERNEKEQSCAAPHLTVLRFITSAPLGNGPAWYLLRCHPRALSRREQKNGGDTCGCHFHKWTRMINASGQLAPLAAAAHHPSSLRRMRVAIKNPVYESGYHTEKRRTVGKVQKVFGAAAPSTRLGPDDEDASKMSLQGTAIVEDTEVMGPGRRTCRSLSQPVRSRAEISLDSSTWKIQDE